MKHIATVQNENEKVPLEVLLCVGVGLVGVVEGDLELVDVSLELLLETKQLGLALGLGLERRLEEGDYMIPSANSSWK